jgi:hypothetical protein
MPIRPELRHHYTTPEWRATSLKIRKERAGDRCECVGECGTDHEEERQALLCQGLDHIRALAEASRCSALEGLPHPVTRSIVRLTVAHMDHNPPSRDETRLRAWCQRCHNRYDSTYRKANAHRTRRSKKAVGDLLEQEDGRR